MGKLNAAALKGRYDVTAISSVAYPVDRRPLCNPQRRDQRRPRLRPVLVSRNFASSHGSRGRRVGVGRHSDDGLVSASLALPEAVPVSMRFDQIADAITAANSTRA